MRNDNTLERTFHLLNSVKTNEKPYFEDKAPLSEIFYFIREGNPLNDECWYEEFQLKEKKERDLIKETEILSWIPSANFKELSSYKEEDIETLTGFQYFDLDNIQQPETIKHTLTANPYITAIWKSCSGRGLGVLVQVEGLTISNYREVYKQIGKEFFNLEEGNLDENCINPGRKNCLGYDPEIYVNPSAISYNPKSGSKPYYNKELIGGSIVALTSGSEIIQACLQSWNNLPAGIRYQPIFFDNQVMRDECNSNTFYRVYPEGKTFYPVYRKKGEVIRIGQRSKTMLSICTRLMLNNSTLLKSDINSLTILYARLKGINNSWLEEPLTEQELLKIVVSCYTKLLQGKLTSSWGKTYNIAWGYGNSYTVKEKLKISASIGRQLKKEKNSIKINQVYNQLLEQGKKPTQKQISKLSGISERTIRKHLIELNLIKSKTVITMSTTVEQLNTNYQSSTGKELIIEFNDNSSSTLFNFTEFIQSIKSSIWLDTDYIIGEDKISDVLLSYPLSWEELKNSVENERLFIDEFPICLALKKGVEEQIELENTLPI